MGPAQERRSRNSIAIPMQPDDGQNPCRRQCRYRMKEKTRIPPLPQPSSAARIFAASSGPVNGFAMKCNPSCSTPLSAITSAV